MTPVREQQKMNRIARLVTVVAVAAVILSTAGCNKLRARDQLNRGVQAFKGANYEEAIEHFKNAVNLDSDLRVAKMYLATAYAQQYVPGVETPENLRNAQLAIEQYKQVLEKDPNNVTSLKGIAFLKQLVNAFRTGALNIGQSLQSSRLPAGLRTQTLWVQVNSFNALTFTTRR